MAFVDQHSSMYGVERLCRLLQVAPSSYWRHAALRRNPALRCARAHRDDFLSTHIRRVWETNFRVYGAEKVWRQLGIPAQRDRPFRPNVTADSGSS